MRRKKGGSGASVAPCIGHGTYRKTEEVSPSLKGELTARNARNAHVNKRISQHDGVSLLSEFMPPTNRKITTPRRSETPPEEPRKRVAGNRSLSVRSTGRSTMREMSPALEKLPRRSVEERVFVRREWSPLARVSASHSLGSIRDSAANPLSRCPSLNGRVASSERWTSELSLDDSVPVSPTAADTESDESGLGQTELTRPSKILPRQLSKAYTSVVKMTAFSSVKNQGQR